MKHWIILVLVAGSAQIISANGSSFGAGFAGGLFGGMVGGAMTRPRYREVTYVEQAPPTYYYSQRERELAAREARLRERERRLSAQYEDDLDGIIYLDEDYIY